ncbi:MAG TPA: ribosome maturation factor RimM [Sphingomonadales bacterium]|nr:ribosome maturation factor RimM [Sphingomonadales bacterium]
MQEKPIAETTRWVAVGQLGAPVGVKGFIRLNAFTKTPERIFAFRDLRAGDDKGGVRIRKAEAKGKNLVAAVEGIGSREAAQKLCGKMLYVDRAEFPPLDTSGEYYQADLIGLEVADENGMRVGAVLAFHDFGAGTLMEIALNAGGPSALVPFREDVIVKVDVKAGYVSARLQDWL